jgi:type II secretory pathway pseudopilin PulG
VLIIGILVAIAVPIFNAAKSNAQKKSCYASMRTIDGASQAYISANGGTIPASVAVLSPAYLKTVPTCPHGGSAYSLTASGTVNACSVDGAYQ